MKLSLEQVCEMAPDSKSVAAAQQIVSPRNWQTVGLSETALWGTYGRGGRFQIRIDFQDMGFRCTCPSRKLPCKHVLALLMLFASVPDSFVIQEPPHWVAEWLLSRRTRAQKKRSLQNEVSKPLDRDAQAKRVTEREDKIASGLQQLTIWMDDLIRGGVGDLERQPYSFWDGQARRLVDAQAKGLAGRIRNLSELPGASRDWPERLANELGRIRLLVYAYEHLHRFSPELQADVRQLIGWTVSKTDLEQTGEVVEDEWFIIGQRTESDERFRTQRSWAIGKESGREALLLQFAPGNQGFEETFHPGSVQLGKLVFYPGAVRQRARFMERGDEAQSPLDEFSYQSSLKAYLDSYASKLGANPWLATCSGLLANVTLATQAGRWYVRDESGNGLPLQRCNHFQLLAETGGQPFQLMGEWNGHAFLPLSFLFQGRFRACL